MSLCENCKIPAPPQASPREYALAEEFAADALALRRAMRYVDRGAVQELSAVVRTLQVVEYRLKNPRRQGIG